jgi:hypothetical protein
MDGNNKRIAELFETVLQHIKCIEARIECARPLVSQNQKYVLGNAINKINAALNSIYSLLPDSDSILRVKKHLDDTDIVYVMLLTEQLMRIRPDDMEEVVELLDNYLFNKYGKSEEVPSNREGSVS